MSRGSAAPQLAVPYMHIRGGTSKGLYFSADDLPSDIDAKDQILLAAMAGLGGDDRRQIDGLGGGDALTSKAAVVSKSHRNDADIDYEFIQVVVGEGRNDRNQNCGNILAGVGPFALETGLAAASNPETELRVFMTNSRSVCRIRMKTPDGRITYTGDTRIDGVPGTAAPIQCYYENIAGSVCGSLFPTGRLVDRFDGIPTTCVDNGMPVVLIRAEELRCRGDESPAELNRNTALKARLESIRLQAGRAMNLGDVGNKVIPKMTLISPAKRGGMLNTRSFIPHQVHASIGVLAAVSIAAAGASPGTAAHEITQLDARQFIDIGEYSIEHPSGAITVSLKINHNEVFPTVAEAGVVRTARALSRGVVLIPEGI